MTQTIVIDGVRREATPEELSFPEPIPDTPKPDYNAELIAAIQAATTIAQLKAALIGSIEGSKARVAGRPK